MSDDVTLYHWAPRERRGQIIRRGLVPGCWSRDRLWRPPYVCFADRPSLAWALSGGMRGTPAGTWDLWETWTDRLDGYEIIPFDDGTPKEYRVYHRVYKRNLWWVAERRVSQQDDD